ncbi:hypothetical protein M422DRAFT_80496, partial [Sphaerobolus stellatus SS14]
DTVEIVSGTERLIASKECLMEAYPIGSWGITIPGADDLNPEEVLPTLEHVHDPLVMSAEMSTAFDGIHTYTDSGASDHCFINREDFTEYNTLTTLHGRQSSNKEGIFKILGYGSVTKVIESRGLHTTITFKSALHTPDL